VGSTRHAAHVAAQHGEWLAAVDWDVGTYEIVAAAILPAARLVIESAGLRQGERVVDIGCGSGNATILAAALGARVTGVDPAPRLLAAAADEARTRGLEASFLRGDATALPLPDACADVVLSVFGVLFAPDAQAAIAEMARIAVPGARIVLTAWLPVGAMSGARDARALALGAEGPPPFGWHDPETLAEALRPHGFAVDCHEAQLHFTGASPTDYVDVMFAEHPLRIADVGRLAPAGALEPAPQRSVEIFTAANEEHGALRVASRYLVATATRA